MLKKPQTQNEKDLEFDIKKNTEILKRYINEIKTMQTDYLLENEKQFKSLNAQISEQEAKINDPVKKSDPSSLLKSFLLNMGTNFDLLKYKETIKKVLNSVKIRQNHENSSWDLDFEDDSFLKKSQELHNLELAIAKFRKNFQENLKIFQKDLKKVFDLNSFLAPELDLNLDYFLNMDFNREPIIIESQNVSLPPVMTQENNEKNNNNICNYPQKPNNIQMIDEMDEICMSQNPQENPNIFSQKMNLENSDNVEKIVISDSNDLLLQEDIQINKQNTKKNIEITSTKGKRTPKLNKNNTNNDKTAFEIIKNTEISNFDNQNNKTTEQNEIISKIDETLQKSSFILNESDAKLKDFVYSVMATLKSPQMHPKQPLKRINIKRQSFSYEGILNDMVYRGNKEAKCHFCKGSSFEKELYRKLGILFGPFEIKEEKYYFHEMCVLWSAGIEMNQINSISHTIEGEIERTRNNKCAKCGMVGAGIHCLDKDCKVAVHFRCLINMKELKINYNKLRFYCSQHFKRGKKEKEEKINKINMEKMEKMGTRSKKIKKSKGNESEKGDDISVMSIS